jgi:hypothetical protein
MHPILEEFCEKWVWPAAPGAPGAAFRLKLTEEKCLKSWDLTLKKAIAGFKEGLDSGKDEWKRRMALWGYASEGVQMSIKQMSSQLLSIDIAAQEQYIDILRMRARQVWDECKHSKLHVDVLLANGWIKNERELMTDLTANSQPLPSYFGLTQMFPHIHPLARAAQHYFIEATACLGILACLNVVEDPMVRHEHLSQRDEEMYHFMEGKYIIDTYCAGPDDQKPVAEAVDYLRHRVSI